MTIEERLEALEKETQKLRDVIEIMNLKGKYFRCLDSKDWDGLETTFSPTFPLPTPMASSLSTAPRRSPITSSRPCPLR